MDEKMEKYIFTCPHCKGELNSWFRGNFRGSFFNKKLNTFRVMYFCTEECYKDYAQSFVVEVYNDKPIYCVEVDGEKRYMPYFEASYYFTNIDDCKKRMDMKGAAVVNLSMYGLLMNR